jgi:hypothetical protein
MSAEQQSVESLTGHIGRLVRERQELRAAGASPAELERNRLELAHAQQQLSRLLIARYHPAAPQAA